MPSSVTLTLRVVRLSSLTFRCDSSACTSREAVAGGNCMLSAARAKLDASTTRANILIEYSRSIPFLDNGFNRNPQRSPTMPISIGSGVLVQLYGSHLVKSAVNPDDSMPTPDFRKPEKSS